MSDQHFQSFLLETPIYTRRRRKRVDRGGEATGTAAAKMSTAELELRELLEATVAGGFDVEEALIGLPSRGVARIALARQVAMYLAHVVCRLTKADAGRLFGRDRTTVHHACVVIEQKRDDEEFDRALEHLERVIKIVVGPEGASWHQ